MEYAGDYLDQGGASHLFNSDLVYHLTRTQHLDMHLGFGPNHNARDYIIAAGYSFRLDGLS